MFPELLLLAQLAMSQPYFKADPGVVLASHTISMDNRYGNTFVNNVFKDNILLSVHYMAGDVKGKNDIDWSEIEKPFKTEFTLNPGEEFAFHEHALPIYKKAVVKTMNSNFMWSEGYKSDGFLVGDGVCHIASQIYWTAVEAGLSAYAPSNHNFAKINEVPREFGVAIKSPSPLGNLYITNTLDKPVTFVFDYDGANLVVKILVDH